jgi:integrating conjugative element protein (TIGR03749 family)
VRIVEGEAATRYGERQPADDGPSAPTRRGAKRRWRLTRYAAQNLYAPRTVEPVAGIGRVNLRRDLALDTLLPTLPVHARALAAWRLEDQWVTAVRSPTPPARWLDLDPRALQGDFLAATFQHPNWGRPARRRHHGGLPGHPGHGLAESLLPALTDRRHGEPAAGRGGRPTGGARDEK